jgi:anti-sigma factor RsiW
VRCEFADSLLQGYFDCELSAASAGEFESHLNHCADCAGELVELDILSGRLQFAQLYKVAPPSLKKKIHAKLQPVMPMTAIPQQFLWHWLAAAAAVLVLVFVGWRWSAGFPSEDYRAELAAEIVDAHVRSLQPGHLTSIDSNDGQAVQDWFKGKVTFATPARDFANEGFALQGGRVDVVEGHSVAVLVYTHTSHLINIFIWPTRERDSSLHAASLQGYQWIDWRKGKLEFCAVSETPTADLQQLQQIFSE